MTAKPAEKCSDLHASVAPIQSFSVKSKPRVRDLMLCAVILTSLQKKRAEYALKFTIFQAGSAGNDINVKV